MANQRRVWRGWESCSMLAPTATALLAWRLRRWRFLPAIAALLLLAGLPGRAAPPPQPPVARPTPAWPTPVAYRPVDRALLRALAPQRPGSAALRLLRDRVAEAPAGQAGLVRAAWAAAAARRLQGTAARGLLADSSRRRASRPFRCLAYLALIDAYTQQEVALALVGAARAAAGAGRGGDLARAGRLLPAAERLDALLADQADRVALGRPLGVLDARAAVRGTVAARDPGALMLYCRGSG